MSKTKLEFRLEVAEAIAEDLDNDGLDYSAGVIRELVARVRQELDVRCVPRCQQMDRVTPELGAIHANGGHPEHVPFGVYEDGRA